MDQHLPHDDDIRELTTDPVVSLLRFWQAVKRHRTLILSALAASIFLAVVVFKRTPAQYESSAALMIRQTTTNTKLETSLAANGLMASYKQLLLSDAVLISTVENLDVLPPELHGHRDRTHWPPILRGMLNVSFDHKENIVTVSCRSRDADSTVRVIRALTLASANFMEDYQQDVSLELVTRLDSERRELRERLFSREQQLLAARKACGDVTLSSGSDEPHPAVLRMTQLMNELTSVRRKRLELESMLNSTQYQVQAGADLSQALQKLGTIVGPKVLSRVPGTGVENIETVSELEDTLKEMISELSALSRHYGSGHAEIIRRQSLIADQQRRLEAARGELHSQIQVGLRSPQVGQWMINTIAAELLTTQQYEASLQQEYSLAESFVMSLSDKLAEIQSAERELDTLRQLHTSLLNRLNAVDLEQGHGAFRVAVLKEPQLPRSPIFPVLSSLVFKYSSLALMLACVAIYILDLIDDRLRSPSQIREQLQLPILGITRKLPAGQGGESGLHVHESPMSVHSECYRTLRTSLDLLEDETHCLAITSTESGEGKSTLCANLATAYAQTGKRTLLIDADMRRPGLSTLLNVRGQRGLSEVLWAEEDIPAMCAERVVSTPVERLEVLPCGPRAQNPGMLLTRPSLPQLVDWAISQYDQVIIDCPPTLAVSDAAIVAKCVDGLMFLVNPTKTHRRGVLRAVEQLRSMRSRLIGVIVNSTHHENDSGYEGYGYGYGYGYATKDTYGDDMPLEIEVPEGHESDVDDSDVVSFPLPTRPAASVVSDHRDAA